MEFQLNETTMFQGCYIGSILCIYRVTLKRYAGSLCWCTSPTPIHKILTKTPSLNWDNFVKKY